MLSLHKLGKFNRFYPMNKWQENCPNSSDDNQLKLNTSLNFQFHDATYVTMYVCFLSNTQLVMYDFKCYVICTYICLIESQLASIYVCTCSLILSTRIKKLATCQLFCAIPYHLCTHTYVRSQLLAMLHQLYMLHNLVELMIMYVCNIGYIVYRVMILSKLLFTR